VIAGRRGRKARRAARRRAGAAVSPFLPPAAVGAPATAAGGSTPSGCRCACAPVAAAVVAAVAPPAVYGAAGAPPLPVRAAPPVAGPLRAAAAPVAANAADARAAAAVTDSAPRASAGAPVPTWADKVAGRRAPPRPALGGIPLLPPEPASDRDAGAAAAGDPEPLADQHTVCLVRPVNTSPPPTNHNEAAAGGVVAARLARAASAGAALRRLAAGAPERVTLRTVYVRGVARETRTWRLRQLLSAVAGLPERAVVDVDRFGDLAEVRLLEPHADAFEAAVALSPSAATLTLVRGVDPLSPSLLGAPRRRGLSADGAHAAARSFFVLRIQKKRQSLEARAGMPPSHRAALRRLLHQALAPHVPQLAGGGAAIRNLAAIAGGRAADACAAAPRGAAAGQGATRSCPDFPDSSGYGATDAVPRRGVDPSRPPASAPAPPPPATPTAVGDSPTPTAVAGGGAGAAGTEDPPRPEGEGCNHAFGENPKAVAELAPRATPTLPGGPSTPVQDASSSTLSSEGLPPPASSCPSADHFAPPSPNVLRGRAPPLSVGAETGTAAARPSTDEPPPTLPLADAVAAVVGRAPGGAAGALSMSAAFFRAAAGAVAAADAADAVSRRPDQASRADSGSGTVPCGARIPEPAAAPAGTGTLARAAAPECRLPTGDTGATGSPAAAGATIPEQGQRCGAARRVAAHDAPLFGPRRLPATCEAGTAPLRPHGAAMAQRSVARTDAAAAAAVCLPADTVCSTAGAARRRAGRTPTDGVLAPPPTPAATRRGRTGPETALKPAGGGAVSVGLLGVAGRTRGASLRAASAEPRRAMAAPPDAGGADPELGASPTSSGPRAPRACDSLPVEDRLRLASQPNGSGVADATVPIALPPTSQAVPAAPVPLPPAAGDAPCAGAPASHPPSACDETTQ